MAERSHLMMHLEEIVHQAKACRICSAQLAHEPRPVFEVSSSAKILIIGQAPGTKVHQSGVPWDDPSGRKLREWLEMSEETFYDVSKVAIMPMGFCYPGKGKSGDLPPRPECAPQWHDQLLGHMPNIEVTLLIGMYAQKWYLKERVQKNLTETVRSFEEYLPKYIPLPHPSPRNRFWFQKNPWFEEELLPVLRGSVAKLMDE